MNIPRLYSFIFSFFIEISYSPSIKRGPGGVSDEFPIKIYSIFGEEVNLTPALSKGEGERIDVSGLAPGVYFLRLGDVVSKFVKY